MLQTSALAAVMATPTLSSRWRNAKVIRTADKHLHRIRRTVAAVARAEDRNILQIRLDQKRILGASVKEEQTRMDGAEAKHMEACEAAVVAASAND